MSALPRNTDIEHARAAKLLAIFGQIDSDVRDGQKKIAVIKRLAHQNDGSTFAAASGKLFSLKLSYPTLYRLYAAYKSTGNISSVARNYAGGRVQIPRELIAEIRRRCTMPGVPTSSSAIDTLFADWNCGNPLPGIGTWREWWQTHHADKPMPSRAPKFPFHRGTLYKHAPKKKSALSASGRIGLSEALQFLMSVEQDSSLLKPGELYVCDDVRLDLICHDVLTGRATEVRAYVMMDWGTRRIVAYTMRAGNALNKSDVRAMIARGLAVGGIRPAGEVTHIYLERGTCVLDEDDVAFIGALTEGRVVCHQTGMISAERWKGAGKDKPVGNFRGKAVLEVFFRRLHIKLGMLPGQRGNRYASQPRSLGFEGQHSKTSTDSLARWSQELAQLDRSFDRRLQLNLPLLWEDELERELGEAIKELNAERGHDFQGFGTATVLVGEGGVTADLPDSARYAAAIESLNQGTRQ